MIICITFLNCILQNLALPYWVTDVIGFKLQRIYPMTFTYLRIQNLKSLNGRCVLNKLICFIERTKTCIIFSSSFHSVKFLLIFQNYIEVLSSYPKYTFTSGMESNSTSLMISIFKNSNPLCAGILNSPNLLSGGLLFRKESVDC